jgi:hypothetical protein
MNRILCRTDITTYAADALIYSTNVQLMLSGGVGASLLQRFGKRFEDDLFAQLHRSGRKLASVGEIFATRTVGLPWKVVYHVVATDPFYKTDPEVVRSILDRCLAGCSDDPDIASVIMSPLGAGYGNLALPVFLEMVAAFSTSDLRLSELIVCCDDADFFEELVCHSRSLAASWDVQGEGSSDSASVNNPRF